MKSKTLLATNLFYFSALMTPWNPHRSPSQSTWSSSWRASRTRTESPTSCAFLRWLPPSSWTPEPSWRQKTCQNSKDFIDLLRMIDHFHQKISTRDQSSKFHLVISINNEGNDWSFSAFSFGKRDNSDQSFSLLMTESYNLHHWIKQYNSNPLTLSTPPLPCHTCLLN